MSDFTAKLFGAAIICTALIVLLKKGSPEGAMSLRLVGGVVLAISCAAAITPIVDYIREISDSVGDGEKIAESCEVLLKALGISLLTHTTAAVCRDAGEGSIAYYVEMGGKIEILILSLPLIREIIEMTVELMEIG